VAMIDSRDFTGNLEKLVDETFEGPPAEGGSAYLDKNAGLFQTIEPLSAAAASRPAQPGAPTIAAHCVHVAYYVEVLHEFLSGRESELDWPGSWRVHEVDERTWDAVRADLRTRYQALRRTIQTRASWDDDTIGDALAILVHTAYHLGAIRQIARTVGR
jgi:uncharacterized damage-inducible protein DinB